MVSIYHSEFISIRPVRVRVQFDFNYNVEGIKGDIAVKDPLIILSVKFR